MPACPHGMPSAAACFTCMEDGPITPQVMPAGEWAGLGDGDVVPAGLLDEVRAQFESDCPECGCGILVGDVIVPAAPGGPWVHPECAD